MDTVQKTAAGSQQRILEFDLASELHHGMMVSNLAYALAEEMGLPHEQCYELAIAGMLHDIGKLKLTSYINGQEQDPLVIEELKYVRMHSALGYEELKGQGYSDFVLESILYHHENYDGSGYPSNKAGDDIPIGARILRVCDFDILRFLQAFPQKQKDQAEKTFRVQAFFRHMQAQCHCR